MEDSRPEERLYDPQIGPYLQRAQGQTNRGVLMNLGTHPKLLKIEA